MRVPVVQGEDACLLQKIRLCVRHVQVINQSRAGANVGMVISSTGRAYAESLTRGPAMQSSECQPSRRVHSAARMAAVVCSVSPSVSRIAHHLTADPRIGRAQSVDKDGRRRPLEPLANKAIIRVAPANTRWAIHVALVDFLARNARHEIH